MFFPALRMSLFCHGLVNSFRCCSTCKIGCRWFFSVDKQGRGKRWNYRVLAGYQDCHVIYQLNISSMNLILNDQSTSWIQNPASQLVYKLHFGAWILLFGPLGQVWVFFLSISKGVFSTFYGLKKSFFLLKIL